MADSGSRSDDGVDRLKTLYAERYRRQDATHLYPVEFVVRALLGTYPNLNLASERAGFRGANALDLGFGDGRNMPLLHNLGFRIHGAEIHPDIVAATAKTMTSIGIDTTLRVGLNSRIPFGDRLFTLVLACHACYYVEEGTTFGDNLREIHRVTQQGGLFIASLPMSESYILRGAEPAGEGHVRITHDPYGLRVGTIFRIFRDEREIVQELTPSFTDLRIGFCDDDFWGIRQRVWTVVGRRRGAGE